jgi:hypothetical protein
MNDHASHPTVVRAGRAEKRSELRLPSRRRAGIAAALACGLLAGRAEANQIARAESLACGQYACADTIEFRCTQASSMICLDVEANGSDEPFGQTFSATTVTVAPSAMLGRAHVVSLPESSAVHFCLTRQGAPGTMKVLLTIAASGTPMTVGHYTARGECYAGNILDGLESKKTVLAVKQDQ